MKNWKPYGALIGLCFLWGTTYLAIRVGVKHFPTFLFSGIRFVLAGGLVVLAFMLKERGRIVWPTVKEFRTLSISGLFIFLGGNLFLCLAEKTVPSGLAALVNTTFPLWIVLVTRLLNPTEKTPLIAFIGILIGFSGQFLVFSGTLFSPGTAIVGSSVFFLVAGVLDGAIGSVILKKNPVHSNPVLTGGLQMLIAGLVTSVIGLFRGEASELNTNADGWLSLAYLVIAGSILGYSFFVYALHHLPATVVSLYAYINPIVAMWLGWLILDEVVTQKSIYAMFITFTGVYIVNYGMQRAKRTKTELNQ